MPVNKMYDECLVSFDVRATSIEEVYMEEVHKSLHELVPKRLAAGAKDRTLAPPEFDEDLYKKPKPLFTAILDYLQKKPT